MDDRTLIQNTISQLSQPVPSVDVLVALLAAPLAALGLLPPQLHAANSQPLPPSAVSVIPQLQRLILTHIAPVWADELARTPATRTLLVQYFVPDLFVNARPAAAAVARSAYAVILATAPLTDFALAGLTRLAAEYPVDRLYRSIFTDSPRTPRPVRDVQWADCVRDLCAVPDRVANALGPRARTDTPPALESGAYLDALSVRTEALVHALAGDPDAAAPPIAYLLAKLVAVGLFPARPPTLPSQPSFFRATLPALRAHLAAPAYTALWHAALLALPSALATQAVLGSLFGGLDAIEPPTDGAPAVRTRVRRDAALLAGVVGALRPGGDAQALWDVATGLVLARDWPEGHARVFVCWLSGGALGAPVDTQALEALLDTVLGVWASPAHIKHSLLSKHRYTTSLFLLALSYLPTGAPAVDALVSNAAFISGISAYIGHLDPAVRRCGMLAAEVVAQSAGRALDFKDWDGDTQDQAWARALRALLAARDVDAPLVDDAPEEDATVRPNDTLAPAPAKDRAAFVRDAGSDSDDSLTGYASPASSRSASPTPSELGEIERDPTLAVGRAHVPRPVYLAQLGALLRGTTNVGGTHGMGTGTGAAGDAHEADRIEAGLAAAEELIRRKRDYGTELAENAVNLTCVLLGLNDNFELEGFAERRQGALTALVACAPTKAAPTLIQEFFKNQYSVEQRFVALNALALGARELAALPVPPSAVPAARTAFPSKTLPAPLHRRYLGSADTGVLPRLVDDISRRALDSERAAAADAPAIARERRLRVAPARPSITELAPSTPLNPYTSTPSTTRPPPPSTPRFPALAAEYFILPLIHAFYACLQDAQAREARTAALPGRARFHGAGTGLVLSAPVLAQLLRTLAVLVHAARPAPAWLAAIAPAALELALAVGTRRVSHTEGEDADADGDGDGAAEARRAKEASVLAAALEVCLVVLDGALALDGGRSLGLEHTALVLGLGEWAGAVFAGLERGLRVPGGGGANEERLSRAAAGVLLKVQELTERWSRSMLDTR